MCKICPNCGAIAEFNAYYGRTTCTRCEWESENERRKRKAKANIYTTIKSFKADKCSKSSIQDLMKIR